MDIFHQICRSCNNERKNMMNIFQSKLLAKSIYIDEMLSCCSQEPVTMDDKYPKQICFLCAKQLEITYKFLLQYKNSKQQFDIILEYIPKCDPEHDQNKYHNASSPLSLSFDSAIEDEIQQQEILSDNSDAKNTSYQTFVNNCMENQSKFNTAGKFTPSECTPPHKEIVKEIGTRIQCSYCTKSFFTTKALILHGKISHKLKFESKRNLSSKCDEVLKNNSILDEHTKVCFAGKLMYDCIVCSKAFMSKAKLEQHSQICFE